MDLMIANMQWVNWIFPKTLRIQTANLPGKPMEYENWMFGDKDGVSRDHALDFAKEQVRNRKRNLEIQADKDRTWICRHTKDLGYCFHAFFLIRQTRTSTGISNMIMITITNGIMSIMTEDGHMGTEIVFWYLFAFICSLSWLHVSFSCTGFFHQLIICIQLFMNEFFQFLSDPSPIIGNPCR